MFYNLANIKIDRQIIFDAIVSLKHRSEKELSSYFKSYVPVLPISSMLNTNTQVLYGRNGTGKTHIFSCVTEYCCNNYLQEKVVPIYIDMRKIGLTRISKEFTHEEIVLIFYKKIITQIFQQLNIFFENQSKHSLVKLFDKKFLTKSSLIKKSIKNIRKSLSFNNIDESISTYVKKIREQYEQNENIKISPHVRIPSTIGKINIDGESKGSSLRGEDIELVIKGMHSIDIENIVAEIENILEVLESKSMMVMIDEWSQIALPLQPLLAEMFRKSLCTSNKISLKFAGLKYVTKFSTNVDNIPQRIGLQAGIDITELADLNRIFTYDIDHGAVKVYLTLIMLHHLIEEIFYKLKEAKPEISHLRMLNKDLYTFVVKSIFENEKTYDYIIKASEGNPRDFLSILSECCNSTGPSNLPIKPDTAIYSSINYFSTMKSENIDDKNILDVFNKIFIHCVKNESKLFLFSQEYCCNVNEICTLFHYRFIHLIEKDIPIIQDNEDIKHFCIYSIDFGKILSLVKTPEGEEKANKIFKSIKFIVDRYVYKNPHKDIIKRLQNIYNESNLMDIMDELSRELSKDQDYSKIDILSSSNKYKHIADYIFNPIKDGICITNASS